MAKPCLKCKRPNGDTALRCLYCGAPFPVPEKSAPAPEPQPETGSEKPEKTAAEAFHVIVSPGQTPEPAAEAAFRKILQLDKYTAQLKLKFPAPWTAKTFYDPAPAQDMAKALMDAGIDAYVVKQSGLEKIGRRIQALGIAALEAERIVFLSAQGDPILLPFSDLFLVVRGKIVEKRERTEDPVDAEGGVSFGKMVMGESAEDGGEKGAVRQWIEGQKVKPRPGRVSWTLSRHSTGIADFYFRSAPASVRVIENDFDYSGLGDIMDASSLRNFEKIMKAVAAGAPGSAVDESFNLVGYAFTDVPSEDKVREDLMAKLADSDLPKKLFDNRTVFNHHSARVYLNLLRETQRKSKSG